MIKYLWNLCLLTGVDNGEVDGGVGGVHGEDKDHIDSVLEIIKKEQAKQNIASEDMMAAIKENAENTESNYKLIFAMFFLVIIVIAVLAVTLRLCLR